MFSSKVKKAGALVLAAFFLFSSLSAGTLVARTKHFDIIYEEESAAAALSIYNMAEEAYGELVEWFGMDPELSIPVYINPDYTDYNAYSTNYPYNRIVLFDTVSEVDSTLANMEDMIPGTFYHELTHTFEGNCISGFSRGLQKAFGDIASPVTAKEHMTESEGVAVLMESKGGKGRLNDPSFFHTMREAALEGADITYLDASGNRDIYPAGSMAYALGASFMEYLEKNYGSEKLAQYLYERGRFSISTSQHSFKKVYGLSIEKEWFKYLHSIEVPARIYSPNTISEKGRYYDLVWKDGLYAYASTSSSIVSFEGGDLDEVLFSSSVVSSFHISDEGRLLVPAVKEEGASVVLYSAEGRKEHAFSDYRSGTFATLRGEEVVVLMGNKGQEVFLSVFDSHSYRKLGTVELGYDVMASFLVDAGDGTVAFILGDSGVEYISLLDLETLSVKCIENPDEMIVRSLSSNGSVLSFCWSPRADRSAMLRYGEVDLVEGTMQLSEKDYLGGVWYPVSDGEGSIYFVSRFLEYSRISKASRIDLDLQEAGAVSYMAFEKAPLPEGVEAFVAKSKAYNPISFLGKGIFLPIGMVDSAFSLNTEVSGLGATAITADPTETHTLQLSMAYDGTRDGFSVIYNYGGWAQVGLARTWNSDGALSAEDDLILSPSFILRHEGEFIQVSETLGHVYGDMEEDLWLNDFSVLYNNSWQKGPGRYSIAGYSVSAGLSGLTPYTTAAVAIPRLLPVAYDERLLLNLPTVVQMSCIFADSPLLSSVIQTRFLSYEVQKSLGVLSLYLSHVDLWGQYVFPDILKYGGEFSPSPYGSLMATATFTPIVGRLGSSLGIEVGLALAHMNGTTTLQPYVGGNLL